MILSLLFELQGFLNYLSTVKYHKVKNLDFECQRGKKPIENKGGECERY